MDELLRAHARSELGPKHPTCRVAWKVLWGVRANPSELQRWWRDHGEGCDRCHATVERVASDHSEAAMLFGLPRILRLPRSTELAWAASTHQDLADPHIPLPEVRFHRLASDLGTGLSEVWCVGCEGRLLLILCGEAVALAPWERGGELQRTDGHGAVDLVACDSATRTAFCPQGSFMGSPALCLEAREPLGVLLGCQISMPGLVRGEFQLATLEERHTAGPLDNLLRLNKVARFLATVEALPPGPEERAWKEFYLRLLARQGRIPEHERKRLGGIPWISDDLRSILEEDA